MASTETLRITDRSRASEISLANRPLIYTFDCWLGPTEENKQAAKEVMEERCAVTAKKYFSTEYKSYAERPIIACFAGEHQGGDIPGSQRIRETLIILGIPAEKIVTGANTITTVYDLAVMHAFSSAYEMEDLTVVTSNFHRRRTRKEIANHFERSGRKKHKPKIEVMTPSSKSLNHLAFSPDVPMHLQIQIEELIHRGQQRKIVVQEIAATAIAYIPNRKLRRHIQDPIERSTHSHTPRQLARIQNLTARMTQNWEKVKEQALAAKKPKFPDMPAHG